MRAAIVNEGNQKFMFKIKSKQQQKTEASHLQYIQEWFICVSHQP